MKKILIGIAFPLGLLIAGADTEFNLVGQCLTNLVGLVIFGVATLGIMGLSE